MIFAEVITDSIAAASPRLTTFLIRYPKFIHAEHCRHRSMSLCVSSSRAVPVSKNLEEARSDELRARPVHWGAEQRGMQSGAEIMTPDAAAKIWRAAALRAADAAEALHALGIHKSIANRLIEPFLHVNVLVTSCEPGMLNFFGLRLDKGAQPEIRALAEAMWQAWQASTPQRLEPGQWHLPFVTDDIDTALALKVSTARCARLSYSSFETGKQSTIEEDLALYGRLVGAQPAHASPAEHQAQVAPDGGNPELGGNLGAGWIQHRKLLAGEAVAPLPEGYRSRASEDTRFSREVVQELARARRKFPSPNLALAALTEETGELAQALLQREPPARIWAEATQVAAMAQRVAVEGDPSFERRSDG
jgi:hypothetical protein